MRRAFSWEDRKYVEQVAGQLQLRGIRVFYDKHEMASLWGKDLYTHLDYVYSGAAKYCVLFVSKHYAARLWTAHERQSAQSRAFRENKEYILPARFDDTEIPGLRQTVGYVDLRQVRPPALAELIVERVGPIIRDEFFPPVPDRLHAALHARTDALRRCIRERAYEFFNMLRRMSNAERRLVFTVFATGCPSEMPQNRHAQVDWLRRHLRWPPRKIVEVASGLRSVGFEVKVRPQHHRGGDSATSPDSAGTLVLTWYDPSVGARGNTNGTEVISAMLDLATENYCTDCGWRPWTQLDFSALSSATLRHHEHASESGDGLTPPEASNKALNPTVGRGRPPAG